jgi:hypothetical protein
MQELHLAYGQNKGKQYTEEEDRFLLVRLEHWGINREDVYELIKRDAGEWPLFRFDWFLKSRTPDELKRRCNTLLTIITKEEEAAEKLRAAGGPKKGGKVRATPVFLFALAPQRLTSVARPYLQKRTITDVADSSRASTPASGTASASKAKKAKKAA